MAVVAVVVLNLTQLLVRGGADAHYTVPRYWWVWLLAIIITSPLQALAEEMFFRGYLMNVISGLALNLPEKAGRWLSVVGSALIFALMHGTQNAWLFADRLAFGLLAGWLVIVTGGLEAGVAAHVVNNLFAFGYAVFLGGVSQARGMTSMGWVDAAWDIGGFLTIALAGWWIGNLMRVARRTPSRQGISS